MGFVGVICWCMCCVVVVCFMSVCRFNVSYVVFLRVFVIAIIIILGVCDVSCVGLLF